MGEGGGDTGEAAAGHEAGGATGTTKMIDDPPPTVPRASGGTGVAGCADHAQGENVAPGIATEVASESMAEQVMAEMRAGQGSSRYGILGGTEEAGSGELDVKEAGKRDAASRRRW